MADKREVEDLAKQVSKDKEKSLRIELVEVIGGSFMMGIDDEWNENYIRYNEDQSPIHHVMLRGFQMSKYQVTQELYNEIFGLSPSALKGPQYPVEPVTWYEAVTFCNALSKKTGLKPCYKINGISVSCDFDSNGYRLPTEAEWEYSARGGYLSKGYEYSGADHVDKVGWHIHNSEGKLHAVGTKQANELGLHDMSGNVAEWCWDWYDMHYYSISPKANPRGPDSGSYRVLRGGSRRLGFNFCHVANRYKLNPAGRFYGNGFRCVRNLE